MRNDNITFSFGENWQSYLGSIDDDDISRANQDILDWISNGQVSGKDVIDIGSGSGLHSYCFYTQKARTLVSLDVDRHSVEATKTMKKIAGDPAVWNVLNGSVLDHEFLSGLDLYDIVYSWGVLHHTGRMWEAIENASKLVRPNGLFWISLYTKGPKYEKDLEAKQAYNNASKLGKKIFIYRKVLKIIWKHIKKKQNPFSWNERVGRGMHKYHDLIDWYGGLPYEVASVDEVKKFLESKGFELIRVQEEKERCCSVYLFKNN